MKKMKIALIVFLCLVLFLAAAIFLLKDSILSEVKSGLINAMESSTHNAVEIDKLNYLPHKGFIISDLYLIDSKTGKVNLKVDKIFANVSLFKMLFSGKLNLQLEFPKAEFQGNYANAKIILHSKRFKSILNPFFGLELDKIQLVNVNFVSRLVAINNLSGPVYISKNAITSDNISFKLNDMPCSLRLGISDLTNNPKVKINLSGKNINGTLNLVKFSSKLIIEKAALEILNSRITSTGEINNFNNPHINLESAYNLDLNDMPHLLPKRLKPSGINIDGGLAGNLDIQGYLKDPKNIDLNLNGKCPRLIVNNFKIDDLEFGVENNNGIISSPLIGARPYGGTISMAFKIDLNNTSYPYAARIIMQDLQINKILKDTDIKQSGIYGKFNLDCMFDGYLNNISSMRGNGKILIKDGNLGPMPILSPLTGSMYSFLTKTFPEIKKVEITGGSCDLAIENEKISTDNLILWGEMLNIKAKGYLGFDGELHFDVENEIKEPPKDQEDWQSSLVGIMTGVGQFINNAQLRGTLAKPKWKFEYFNGAGTNIKKVFSNLFE